MTASPEHGGTGTATEARQRWMSVLARASATELAERLRTCPPLPDHVRLRGPETGLVMVRGRAGGAGGRFNLGELAVTRCTVRAGEQIGHAYVTGRDAAQADLMRAVIAPLADTQMACRATTAARAEATKVQFFTMATMRS
jgi:alpha-D-ribose 1-methylphosphonate 5-triphosphate synthase subunit PhnG